MRARKDVSRPGGPRLIRVERIKDEVYRQMFLLEERRPGAELGLAVALLRAWLAAGSKATNDEKRDWLKKISPICLEMIEAALRAAGTAHRTMR